MIIHCVSFKTLDDKIILEVHLHKKNTAELVSHLKNMSTGAHVNPAISVARCRTSATTGRDP